MAKSPKTGTQRKRGDNRTVTGAQPARQIRNPDDTKRRILEAAVQEFCDFGFHGARIDNIAKRAGSNKRLIYAYIGSKEDVYLRVLEDSYLNIRSGERQLHLDELSPVDGMRTLTRFTFQHFQRNPTFIRLLIGENLNEARFLKRIATIGAMHSPLIGQIRELLARGERDAVFRRGVDPIQLYISIAALGFFYLSNRYTLSTIFDVDLMTTERLLAREEHIVNFVMSYLASEQVDSGSQAPFHPFDLDPKRQLVRTDR